MVNINIDTIVVYHHDGMILHHMTIAYSDKLVGLAKMADFAIDEIMKDYSLQENLVSVIDHSPHSFTYCNSLEEWTINFWLTHRSFLFIWLKFESCVTTCYRQHAVKAVCVNYWLFLPVIITHTFVILLLSTTYTFGLVWYMWSLLHLLTRITWCQRATVFLCKSSLNLCVY